MKTWVGGVAWRVAVSYILHVVLCDLQPIRSCTFGHMTELGELLYEYNIRAYLNSISLYHLMLGVESLVWRIYIQYTQY